MGVLYLISTRVNAITSAYCLWFGEQDDVVDVGQVLQAHDCQRYKLICTKLSTEPRSGRDQRSYRSELNGEDKGNKMLLQAHLDSDPGFWLGRRRLKGVASLYRLRAALWRGLAATITHKRHTYPNFEVGSDVSCPCLLCVTSCNRVLSHAL